MQVQRVLAAAGMAGFYIDDLEAIRQGAREDGFVYRGSPLTPGFDSIRQPGEAVSVIFLLENGDVAYGDCVIAQYVGVGGRQRPLTSDELVGLVERVVAPFYEGRDLTEFRSEAEAFDTLIIDGSPLPASLRYGVTQAVLETVAKHCRITMAEVILREYGLEPKLEPVLINVQSGDDRYTNVDKMILKKADIIPHGLINSVDGKLGRDGELFLDYAAWVTKRVSEIGAADYHPKFRFDVYGCIGKAFDDDLEKVTDYMIAVEKVCAPYEVLIEMPIDLGDKPTQMKGMKRLCVMLEERGSAVRLIVDEYANTLEDIIEWVDSKSAHVVHVKTIDLGGINNVVDAVLYCKEHDVLAYQGGTCNETDKAAQVCVNLAVATQPFAMLAKPGMGLDEGLMIVNNEQQRLLAILGDRQRNGHLRSR